MSEQDLSNQGQRLRDEFNSASKQAGGAVADAASKARDTVKQYGQQGYDMARQRAEQAQKFTEGYVKENPWYALGIALGVGILVGLVARGGSRD